jgi:hypothetical protein
MSKIYLIAVFLVFFGCAPEETEPYIPPAPIGNRVERFAQGFVTGLTFDSSGSQGILTSICTSGYSYHGCSVSCSSNGSSYTSAVLTCNADTATPTDFVTVACSSQEAYSQGLQGDMRVTITPTASDTVRMVFTATGALYVLNSTGNYLPDGLWGERIGVTLVFRKTIGSALAYSCEENVSSVTIAGVPQDCASLTFPLGC